MPNNLKNPIQIDNFFFETDDIEGIGLRNGASFEPEVLFSLNLYIKPGDVVLDIGANIGYFTAFMAKYVGPTGTVHAFEPEPRNFELLQRNAITNNLKNVKLHNIALSDKAGLANLHISDFSGGMHRLYESFCCGNSAIEVPIQRLDDIFNPGQISVIKIDVEGFEPFVLKGGQSLIVGQNITIISEYCPPAILEAGAHPQHFIQNLMNWNMQVYESNGILLDWDVLMKDALKWENFGQQRLISECKGKSNPEIAVIVEAISTTIGCSRPYIENLIFRSKSTVDKEKMPAHRWSLFNLNKKMGSLIASLRKKIA